MADREEIKQTLKNENADMQQVVSNLPEAMRSSVGDYKDKEAVKAALISQRDNAQATLKQLNEHPDKQTIEYVLTNLNGSLMGMYSPEINAIAIDEKAADSALFNTFIDHELHHQYVNLTKTTDQPMNLEQRSLLVKHEEISAHLTSLVGERQEYKMAKTDEEREAALCRMRRSSHDFYADAIEKGEVNPLSENPDDFKKEMKFMFDGTQKMWMKDYDELYAGQVSRIAANHFDTHNYDELKKNDENYNLARKNIYTIGGYDFSKFSDNECVKCNDEHILWQDKAIEAGAKRSYVKDPYQFEKLVSVQKPLEEKIETPEVRNDLSLEQQYQLQKYRTLVEAYEELRCDGTEADDAKQFKEKVGTEIRTFALNLRSEYVHQSVTEFSEKLINSGENPKGNNALYQKELNEICTINGVNVLKEINNSGAVDIMSKNEDAAFAHIDEKFSMDKFLKNVDKQPDDVKEQVLGKIKSDGESFGKNYQAYLQKMEEQKNEAKKIRSLPLEGHEGTEEDKKATKADTKYYGAPKYPENAVIKKRDDVLDLNKPLLAQELAAREMKTAADNALMQIDATQAASNVREAVKQQKEPEITNKEPKKQEPTNVQVAAMVLEQSKQKAL